MHGAHTPKVSKQYWHDPLSSASDVFADARPSITTTTLDSEPFLVLIKSDGLFFCNPSVTVFLSMDMPVSTSICDVVPSADRTALGGSLAKLFTPLVHKFFSSFPVIYLVILSGLFENAIT